MASSEINPSILLRLPAEVRLQIYEWVVPRRVIHVRMRWTGNHAADGFAYSCLEDTRSLRERHQRNVLSHAIPFGAEPSALSQTCRTMHQETALLPFETFTWAFETAFTLDHWIYMKEGISKEHKKAIRAVAVPTPGPYRSSERFLLNLREILLIGTAYSTTTYFTHPKDAKDMDLEITKLEKDKASGTWNRNGKKAQYAKDLFV